MRIAFTHNVQLTNREEEAEFDRPETIAAIAESIAKLGHDVELVEVSGPASRLVARLEAGNPDLVFNTAEGNQGRYREAFYPGLFEQLGIPYTGSDAYVCALTLDKQLTKMMVGAAGIPTPRWLFVDDMSGWKDPELTFPVIVKPNFEGSSKGITVDSIVEEPAQLKAKVAAILKKYPSGLLIEEFIIGRDVVVPFLEKASAATGGVLTPVSYSFDEKIIGPRKYTIYDYELKCVSSDAVEVQVPAPLPKEQLDKCVQLSRKVFQVLGVRDLGRIDYRVTEDGRVYFLEVNALPSLEPGAGIYLSSALAGLKDTSDVLGAVIESACARAGINPRRGTRKKKTVVGLAFNLKRAGGDQDAEYDTQKTIDAVKEAIASFGHDVVELEATPELPAILPAAKVDVVFNIAEGIRGRNREAQVPAILELLDIPYTGSDAATLSIALDKALAKRIVREAGVPTPKFFVMTTGNEKLPSDLKYPVIAKPNIEGSSKGVNATSVVGDEAELRALVKDATAKYRQPILVEEFLTGREFTVALLGEARPKALPAMEIVHVQPDAKWPVYGYEEKQDWSNRIRYDRPAQTTPQLARELERVAKTVFTAMGCRDVARVDLRCDAQGVVNFIECNPLPGLSPGWSDLCLIAESAGMDYRTLIGEILAPALKRFKQRARARRESAAENGRIVAGARG